MRYWIAGKLIKFAMWMLDEDTRYEVFRLLGIAARKGML